MILLDHDFGPKLVGNERFRTSGFGFKKFMVEAISLPFEHGYFRSQGRGGNLSKKRRNYCSRCHVTMRVGAIESPMFVVFQKIFFRTVGLLKKFLSSIEVMVHHIFHVWVPSQNFWKSKKCLWMSKIDFHKKFEKSFHEMFLMITAIFKTFDESNVSNRVHIYCFDVYLFVSWREMRQNCKNNWTTAKINSSQLSELKYK